MKNNVKRAWWKKFVQESPYNVGQDAAILMNPQVWVASGHVNTFNDPLIDCKACKMRHRADKLIEDYLAANGIEDVNVEAMDNDSLVAYIREKQIPCPGCGKSDFTDIRKFNLMFKTHQGVTEDSAAEVYLRPETAQGIFVNFNNLLRTTRREAALRRVPNWQILPQRDHPGQLHLPDPGVRADGAGVLLQTRHGSGVVPVLEELLPPMAPESGHAG